MVGLTQSGQSLQLVLAVGGVRPADLEDLVLPVAAGLAQQSPVGAWNHSPIPTNQRPDLLLCSEMAEGLDADLD